MDMSKFDGGLSSKALLWKISFCFRKEIVKYLRSNNVKATAFQIQVLHMHYIGHDLPANFPYTTGLRTLWDKLGEEKLGFAIALVPNNPNLSYQQAGTDLPVLDLWFSNPELFEEMSAEKLESLQDSPEILYADGERALITIGRKTYRYWKD